MEIDPIHEPNPLDTSRLVSLSIRLFSVTFCPAFFFFFLFCCPVDPVMSLETGRQRSQSGTCRSFLCMPVVQPAATKTNKPLRPRQPQNKPTNHHGNNNHNNNTMRLYVATTTCVPHPFLLTTHTHVHARDRLALAHGGIPAP